MHCGFPLPVMLVSTNVTELLAPRLWMPPAPGGCVGKGDGVTLLPLTLEGLSTTVPPTASLMMPPPFPPPDPPARLPVTTESLRVSVPRWLSMPPPSVGLFAREARFSETLELLSVNVPAL